LHRFTLQITYAGRYKFPKLTKATLDVLHFKFTFSLFEDAVRETCQWLK